MGYIFVLMAAKNYKEIVKSVISQLDNQASDEIIVQQLANKFGLDDSEASWAIEMVRTAGFRSGFIKAGMKYPKSNLDNDLYLNEALRLILADG